MKKRVVQNPSFTPFAPKYLGMSDPVIVLFDGRKWKVIALTDVFQYPVIYDEYFENSKRKIDVSITFCPFSFSAVVYFDRWIPTNDIDRNVIILENEHRKEVKINQLTGKLIGSDSNYIVRKHEVIIMNVKTVINNYPDCLYFSNKSRKIEALIPEHYLITNKILHTTTQNDNIKDKYHPKKLVYGVLNSSTDEIKAIISKSDELDFNDAGYQDYFDANIKDIKNAGGFIVPCLWFTWTSYFPKSQVIEI